MDARLSYSRQWTAIENSPSSVLLTFNTNLSKEKDQVLRYSYADRKYRIGKGHLDYNYRRIKHGVGLKATYDKVNVFNYTDVLLSYACHVPLNPYFTLSVGIGGGMSLSTLDVTGNYIGNSDDPLLNAGKRNEITRCLRPESGCIRRVLISACLCQSIWKTRMMRTGRRGITIYMRLQGGNWFSEYDLYPVSDVLL